MKKISLIFFLVALSANPAISKIYEYKNYLEDNNIQPLVKSSEENSVDIIEFGVEDIVRSGLVKEFILAKMELNL